MTKWSYIWAIALFAAAAGFYSMVPSRINDFKFTFQPEFFIGLSVIGAIAGFIFMEKLKKDDRNGWPK